MTLLRGLALLPRATWDGVLVAAEAAPGVVTVLIYVFIAVWNDDPIALTLITTDALKPILVGLSAF